MKQVERRGQHRVWVQLGLKWDLVILETGVNNLPFAEDIFEIDLH